MRTLTIDGKTREIDEKAISLMIENELCEYSKSDKETIANCIGHLIADLECESSLMYGLKPERYYFDAVAAYLNDGHTIYDLNNIEDDAEVFNYCE